MKVIAAKLALARASVPRSQALRSNPRGLFHWPAAPQVEVPRPGMNCKKPDRLLTPGRPSYPRQGINEHRQMTPARAGGWPTNGRSINKAVASQADSSVSTPHGGLTYSEEGRSEPIGGQPMPTICSRRGSRASASDGAGTVTGTSSGGELQSDTGSRSRMDSTAQHFNAVLAQLVERLPCKERVAGSSPCRWLHDQASDVTGSRPGLPSLGERSSILPGRSIPNTGTTKPKSTNRRTSPILGRQAPGKRRRRRSSGNAASSRVVQRCLPAPGQASWLEAATEHRRGHERSF